jgi:UDP-3-O-[3-hydroxymyristoyl] glucosamine N-acyltransferase
MADSRFFRQSGTFSLSELAELAEAELGTKADPDFTVVDTAALDTATQSDISFLENRKYLAAFESSKAGACVIIKQDEERAPAGMNLLISGNPYRSFALITRAFYPEADVLASHHQSAVVSASAKVSSTAGIAAGVVIGDGAEIGDGVEIGANVYIGPGVIVGAGTRIGASASLEYCIVGRNCRFHAGVRIGTRGFGVAMDARGHVELPQIGRVLIGDDVEIGANSTIDRGMGPDTKIGDGTKIDNLVQIGHNVVIGRHCIIAAQTGIAGSTTLGDFVICAAKVGIIGHLEVGSGSRIAGMSGVVKNVAPGETVAGIPAGPHREWLRKQGYLENIAKKRGK